jgi:hypothetical protein
MIFGKLIHAQQNDSVYPNCHYFPIEYKIVNHKNNHAGCKCRQTIATQLTNKERQIRSYKVTPPLEFAGLSL